MTNTINWMHFEQITSKVNRIKATIKQIAKDIDRLKGVKEAILDDPELRAELKKIIDVYPDATMESIIEDYNQFQALRDWLQENNYI